MIPGLDFKKSHRNRTIDSININIVKLSQMTKSKKNRDNFRVA